MLLLRSRTHKFEVSNRYTLRHLKWAPTRNLALPITTGEPHVHKAPREGIPTKTSLKRWNQSSQDLFSKTKLVRCSQQLWRRSSCSPRSNPTETWAGHTAFICTRPRWKHPGAKEPTAATVGWLEKAWAWEFQSQSRMLFSFSKNSAEPPFTQDTFHTCSVQNLNTRHGSGELSQKEAKGSSALVRAARHAQWE